MFAPALDDLSLRSSSSRNVRRRAKENVVGCPDRVRLCECDLLEIPCGGFSDTLHAVVRRCDADTKWQDVHAQLTGRK